MMVSARFEPRVRSVMRLLMEELAHSKDTESQECMLLADVYLSREGWLMPTLVEDMPVLNEALANYVRALGDETARDELESNLSATTLGQRKQLASNLASQLEHAEAQTYHQDICKILEHLDEGLALDGPSIEVSVLIHSALLAYRQKSDA